MVVPVLLFLGFVHDERFAVGAFRFASVLGVLRQQGKVETFERRRAFGRQLFADALFFLEAFDFMAAGAAVLFDFRLAVFGEFRIVHERHVAGRLWRRKRE